jgi:hypothetical protein
MPSDCTHPPHRSRNVRTAVGTLDFCTAWDLVFVRQGTEPRKAWRMPTKAETAAIVASFDGSLVTNDSTEPKTMGASKMVTLPASELVAVDGKKLAQAQSIARYLTDGHGTHYARIDKAQVLASLVLALTPPEVP